MIEERESMINEVKEVEQLSKDPNRLIRRDSWKILKREEDASKLRRRGIPKVSKMIEKSVLEWEKRYGEQLVVDDMRLVDQISQRTNESKSQEQLRGNSPRKSLHCPTKSSLNSPPKLNSRVSDTESICSSSSSSVLHSPKKSPLQSRVKTPRPSVAIVHSLEDSGFHSSIVEQLYERALVAELEKDFV